jgi:O-antigen/teichoic acid export membrane protein
LKRLDQTSLVASSTVDSIARWGSRGAWAITDQALVSGGSFLVNVLLARWLDPAGYGAYALGTYSFLLISTLHDALILEPMSVLGPARYSDRLPDYFRTQLRLHWTVAAFFAVLLLAGAAVASLAAPSSPLSGGLLGAALATPCILLNWLARRFSYVLGRIRAANLGALVFIGAAILGLTTIRELEWMTPIAGFAVMAVASTIAAIVQLLRLPFDQGTAANRIERRVLIQEQWEFGRWQVGAATLRLVGVQAQAYVVATYLGLAATGALRAMELAILPMSQTMTALGTLAMPTLAKEFGRRDPTSILQRSRLFTSLLVLLAVLYALALALFHSPLERLVYDGKYSESAWLIPIFGLIPIATALTIANSLILRAAQKPKYYLVSAAFCAPFGLASAVAMTWLWGIAGAVWSLLATQVLNMLITHLLRRHWVPARPAS